MLAVAASAILAALLVFVGLRESADPRFAFTGLGIAGASHTTAADIDAAAAISAGENVWLIDTRAAQRRIESLPWVASATIERSWPNRVAVRVVERTPVARLSLTSPSGAEEPTEETALFDGSMRVLAVGTPNGSALGLPTIDIRPRPSGVAAGADLSGSDVERAYDALVQLRALGVSVSRVDVAPATGITVSGAAGLRVIIGSDDDLAKKVELLRAIAPQITSPQDVVYVDLRSVRAPTVLYR